MEQLKKAIRRNVTGRAMTDQFYVDGDVNVPDSRGDIERVLCARGELKVEDIKPAENYVRVSGKVIYQILYITQDGQQGLASMQGKLPFEEMVYAEEAPEGAVYVKDASVELSASVVHSRKLSLKAVAEIQLNTQKETEEVLTLDVEEEPGLYRLWESKEILKLHAVKKDTCRIKEELSLPRTKETIGTILYTEISRQKLDTRLGADEAILRGELLVFVLYESPDGKIDWIEQTVPYEGRVQCGGAEDTMYHHINARITDEGIDVRMDEDGEMRLLGVEATLEVRLAVYSEESLEVLKDLYSLHKQCKLDREELTVDRLVMQNHSNYNLADQISLPEPNRSILQICHIGGRLLLLHSEVVADGIMAEGVLHVSVLYVKADDEAPFDVWQGMVPFTYVIECGTAGPGMKYELEGNLEQIQAGPLGSGEIEIKASVGFRLFLCQPEQVTNIRQIEVQEYLPEELEKGPGIIGYVVKEGDDLWELAKRYHTTIDGMKDVNQIQGDQLKPGEKLLIFKENMSIL